ncbi:hypothetical protein IE077_001573 [Cardiosporidium cionae]|uniref:Uncharacterized protein n=1 Tax=Cardiosporidium cionae TaxID=476202 RepID=A0ABQ7JCX5_9APIC|nr:hypothetical protein IE077_001573 [Cardiosporidium cionae]|eukprot:KAF8821793.1 hypothetical protein IE077_001573 [Cardiosporidium cionae]
MEHRYGPLFYHAPLHVERFIRDYTMDELACIMHGYARLNISHFSLFDILCERLSYLLEVYEANMKKSEIVSSSLPSKESLSNFVDPLATADIALAEETTEFNTMAIKRKKMEPLSTVLIELHSPKHISKQRQKHVCTESFIRILSSMSQFHLSNEKIFLSLGNILCHRIASLRPQDIRKIVSSYSQCHYYPPSFMAALLLRFNEAPIHWLIAYTQEDLKRLYISLSSLGFNPSKLGIYKLWTIEDDAEASSTGKYEEPNEYRTVLSKMLEELEAATQSTFRELQVPEQREFACIPYEIRHKVLSENNSESFLDLCDGNEWQTYNFIASH